MQILDSPAASGLFLVQDFLDAPLCAAVRAEARAAAGHPAPVYIFLNGGGAGGETFGGGELPVYRARDGGAGAGPLVFPVTGEPGLLVAFRSDTVHEVAPVTRGERFTVVSWFN